MTAKRQLVEQRDRLKAETMVVLVQNKNGNGNGTYHFNDGRVVLSVIGQVTNYEVQLNSGRTFIFKHK